MSNSIAAQRAVLDNREREGGEKEKDIGMCDGAMILLL